MSVDLRAAVTRSDFFVENRPLLGDTLFNMAL
jgi:hypothetical protein